MRDLIKQLKDTYRDAKDIDGIRSDQYNPPTEGEYDPKDMAAPEQLDTGGEPSPHVVDIDDRLNDRRNHGKGRGLELHDWHDPKVIPGGDLSAVLTGTALHDARDLHDQALQTSELLPNALRVRQIQVAGAVPVQIATANAWRRRIGISCLASTVPALQGGIGINQWVPVIPRQTFTNPAGTTSFPTFTIPAGSILIVAKKIYTYTGTGSVQMAMAESNAPNPRNLGSDATGQVSTTTTFTIASTTGTVTPRLVWTAAGADTIDMEVDVYVLPPASFTGSGVTLAETQATAAIFNGFLMPQAGQVLWLTAQSDLWVSCPDPSTVLTVSILEELRNSDKA